MSISNDVLSIILIQSNWHVEELFSPGLLRIKDLSIFVLLIVARLDILVASTLTKLKDPLDVVLFADDIGVNCIHRNVVVIKSLLLQGIFVELKIVTLENLVFIQRKRVFYCHVLNVFVCLRFSSCLLLVILTCWYTLMDIIFCFVLWLNDEFVQDWNVFKLLNFDLENVLHLLVGLSGILRVWILIFMPITFFAFIGNWLFLWLSTSSLFVTVLFDVICTWTAIVLVLSWCWDLLLTSIVGSRSAPWLFPWFFGLRSIVFLILDKFVEVSKHYLMIPLRLKVHFCTFRI